MKNEKLKRFALILKERFTGAEVNSVSVMIAYYLLLSLFPLLIAVGNIMPLLGMDANVTLGYLDAVVPVPVMQVLEPVIRDLLASASGGLLSVGLLGAVWSSSRGISYMRRGLNKAYGVSPNAGSFVAKKLVSVVTILLILLLLVAFALVFSVGESILEALAPTFGWAGALAGTLYSWKWPVTVVVLFCMLALVYRVAPNVRLRIRDALPGAAFSTAGLLVLVQLFTLYLRFFTRSYSGYGTLGAFFVLMFWLNFSAQILVLGAVLNAAISEYRFGKAEEEVSGVDRALARTGKSLMERLRRRRRKGG